MSGTPDVQVPKPLTPTPPKPSLNRQEPSKKRESTRTKAKAVKTLIPENFAISEGVKAWAKKKGISNLEAHLEAFVLKCEAKGYANVNWDSAFKGAIRDNWAGVTGTGAASAAGRDLSGMNYRAGFGGTTP
jgi:hypothetical protein